MAISPNVQPIFIKDVGLLGSLKLTNQVTSRDGLTGTVQTWYDPDTTDGGNNGAFLECIQIEPIGVNVATVLYLYYNMSSDNTWRIFQTVPIPACTAISATGDVSPGSTFPIEIATHSTDKRLRLPVVWSPIGTDTLNPVRGIRLNPTGVKYGVGLGTAVAAGLIVSFWGGKY